MRKRLAIAVLGLVVIAVAVLYVRVSGVFDPRLAAPAGEPVVRPVPDNWSEAQARRRAQKAEHLNRFKTAFDRFANGAVSETDGIPLVILKLLPVVAPEFWGGPDNFLSVIGLFDDERNAGYPFPRGIGFSGMTRKDPLGDIDYASFTCGGCHIGRVRHPDGRYEYLDGGVNSEFDVIGYRKRIVQSIDKVSAATPAGSTPGAHLVETLLKALDAVTTKDPHYFYNNYSQGGTQFDAGYEAGQVALFRKTAEATIAKFSSHQQQAYGGWKYLSKHYYPEIESRIVDGFPGMEDAIGFNAVKGYLGLKASALTRPFASLALPRSPGITDIMVVWDQDSRNPRWNADESDLVNGGGQWNGHIPLPMFKNIAAQITLGFDNVDITVSAFADRLLDKLPPTVYPFDVNVPLAKEGQALFAENCAACHQPNNGRVYRMMGTHEGRALIAGTIITGGAQSGFTADAVCSPTTTVEMEGEAVQPCAVYKGVSMEGKNRLAMTPPDIHDGYNALPLTGLWAQAPYLHNGSVPTLFHMLIPSERPASFVKSRLDYDAEKVGFSWDPALRNEAVPDEGYLYEPGTSPIIGSQGHDADITEGGVTYKLNWEDDRAGAMALIEYLKTL